MLNKPSHRWQEMLFLQGYFVMMRKQTGASSFHWTKRNGHENYSNQKISLLFLTIWRKGAVFKLNQLCWECKVCVTYHSKYRFCVVPYGTSLPPDVTCILFPHPLLPSFHICSLSLTSILMQTQLVTNHVWMLGFAFRMKVNGWDQKWKETERP